MYPEVVTEYTDDLSNHFRDWAKAEDLDPDKFCTIFSYELSKRVFPKWIQDSTDFLLEEEEILDAMNFSYTEYHLQSLQDKGLIDCIDNEEGETIWFATEKGKSVDINSNTNQN
jgi:hypothetical protein